MTKLLTSNTVLKEQQFKDYYSLKKLRLLKRINEDFYEKAEVLYFQESIFVLKKLKKDMLKQHYDKFLTDNKNVNIIWIKFSKKYFFLKMRKKIKKYIKKCEVCAKTKKTRQFESSLQSLKVSNRFWQSITMNFLTDLSKSENSITKVIYDEILVIIDRFFKITKFISVKSKQTAKQLTYILIKKLVVTEEMSESIIFDRNKLFVSKFWTILMTKLEIRKKMSTAFHSQTNEQTERLN